jgi:hypothetical protein
VISSFLSASGSEASQPACKHVTRILRQILRCATAWALRDGPERAATAGNLIDRRFVLEPYVRPALPSVVISLAATAPVGHPVLV